MFKDILLVVDYDRTLTGRDSVVPPENLQAIEYFMANGGAFTLNTGRSTTTMKSLLHTIPVNAPFLLYNGSAAWENGTLSQIQTIDVPLWDMVAAVRQTFPEMNTEIQGVDNHYLVDVRPEFSALYDKMGWGWAKAAYGADYGPFLKLAVYGEIHRTALSDLYEITPAEEKRFTQLERFFLDNWGDKIEVFRAAPRILDIQAKGVSKGNAALALKDRLGKKILVAVGDAENDISMLNAADYAFCPCDAVVADRFPNVRDCGNAAIADVIYNKLPKILKNAKP